MADSIYQRLSHAIVDSTYGAAPKMLIFGVIAVGGFPLYYYVWTLLFPQPYENMDQRLVLAAIAVPLLFARYWPHWSRPFLPLYWFSVLTLCMPFHFTFMLLHNGTDSIWPMASAAAIMVLFMVIDSVTAIVIQAIGAALAIAVYTLLEGNSLIPWGDFLELVPVYLFTLIVGAAFNLSNERLQRARSLTARAFGGHVAHELGNPLTSIRGSAKETKEYVPALVDTYRMAKRHGLTVPPISESHLEFLGKVGKITEVEVDYSLMVIDMMLKKAGVGKPGSDALEKLAVLACVQEAIAHYAFKGSEERKYIRVATETDFIIFANQTLFRHILFNLLKNSLYAIKAARRRNVGVIQVWAVPGQRTNRLHIRDNGIGMSQETIKHVFDPFFTTRDKGTGLGLHFCRDVMHRFGGEISCISKPGVFTEFVLSFPVRQQAFLPVALPTEQLDVPPGDQPRGRSHEAPARWRGGSQVAHRSAP